MTLICILTVVVYILIFIGSLLLGYSLWLLYGAIEQAQFNRRLDEVIAQGTGNPYRGEPIHPDVLAEINVEKWQD
jgi:hypothetical protein